MRKVARVRVLQGYCLELEFDDGRQGTADLADLAGKGVFALWSDRGAFEQVRIGASGELIWGDRVDLCPDSLYLRVTGKRPEDIFPTLRQDSALRISTPSIATTSLCSTSAPWASSPENYRLAPSV